VDWVLKLRRTGHFMGPGPTRVVAPTLPHRCPLEPAKAGAQPPAPTRAAGWRAREAPTLHDRAAADRLRLRGLLSATPWPAVAGPARASALANSCKRSTRGLDLAWSTLSA